MALLGITALQVDYIMLLEILIKNFFDGNLTQRYAQYRQSQATHAKIK